MGLLLDQPATVSWVEGVVKQPDGKMLPNSKSKDFESVRLALRFIMETMNEHHRPNALIYADNITLHEAAIKGMYAVIK